MTDRREDSCAARIAAHMESREEDFATLFAIANDEKEECETCDGNGTVYRDDDDQTGHKCTTCDGTGTITRKYDDEELDEDGAIERLDEYPLGASVRRVLRIDLSTGGPGDWIEADIDEDGAVESVDYHFADWFDHAERRVLDDSPLWRAAEYYAEGFAQ